MQSASAAFIPTLQATIPDLLSDEREYTSALSLSRLACDLEALVSPMLTATALLFVSFDALFTVNGLGLILPWESVRGQAAIRSMSAGER